MSPVVQWQAVVKFHEVADMGEMEDLDKLPPSNRLTVVKQACHDVLMAGFVRLSMNYDIYGYMLIRNTDIEETLGKNGTFCK